MSPRHRKPRSPRRRVITAAVQAAVLVGAVAATAAFVTADHTVRVSVDGQVRTVHTFRSTAGAALDAAGLKVGPHDVVSPAPGEHVADGEEVVLQRGREVRLTLGAVPTTAWTTATTVGDALTQLGLVRYGEWVSAPDDQPIGLGGTDLAVRLPQRVVVVHDGAAQPVTTTAPTVTAMLATARIVVGAHDTLSVAGGAYPTQDLVVRITRVVGGQLVDDEVVPQTTTRVADGDLYVGDQQVTDPGSPGVIRSVYAVTYVDGKVAAKTLVSKAQTAAMQPRVVHYGTKAKPVAAAPAPTSGGGLDWGALAQCESGGDPTLVSGDGQYYGLYQFSLSTWQGVGGTGKPTQASSAEQTRRAQILYGRVGRSAWPTCGRYL